MNYFYDIPITSAACQANDSTSIATDLSIPLATTDDTTRLDTRCYPPLHSKIKFKLRHNPAPKRGHTSPASRAKRCDAHSAAHSTLPASSLPRAVWLTAVSGLVVGGVSAPLSGGHVRPPRGLELTGRADVSGPDAEGGVAERPSARRLFSELRRALRRS